MLISPRFWGIFFIDASSASAAERGLLTISQKFAVEKSVEGIKRWFSNQTRPWLLIFDNADDPQLDLSRFFPAGGRGVVLITTRNPQCEIHATKGSSKLDQMALEEAITLLLRTSCVTSVDNEASRNSAKHIVQTLGCLALAIIHAGATIQQGVCTLDDYCAEYARHRKQLLDCQHIQAGTDYDHTVYSTWEVSIEKITGLSTETAKNAIELLNFFSVLHFEGISEKILERAWESFQDDELSTWIQSHRLSIFNSICSEQWNPQPFREAIALLSSYSLIHIDGSENHISLHPLVHTWIKDRLAPADQSKCYITSTITLSRSMISKQQSIDISYAVNVQKHIDSCFRFGQNELWIEDEWSKDRISVAYRFGWACSANNDWKQARDFLERTLEYSKKTMNEEYINSLYCTNLLGRAYYYLDERQKGTDLLEKAFTMARNMLGPEDPRTLSFMRDLIRDLLENNRNQESMDLIGELQILEKENDVLRNRSPEAAESIILYADALSRSGNNRKAVELLEDLIPTLEESLGMDHNMTTWGKWTLAEAYRHLNQWQEAAELDQQVLESYIKVFGTEHRATLRARSNLAISYENLDRPLDGIRILTEVVNTARNTYGDEDPDTIDYVELLKRMQAIYDRSIAGKAAESSSSSSSRLTLKKMVLGRQRS